MKKQFRLIAIIAVLFTLAASVTAEAGPWRHRGYYGRGYYGHHYYRPYARPYRPYYARPLPPRPPVVVVGPRWGYGPRYYGGGYRHRSYRRW